MTLVLAVAVSGRHTGVTDTPGVEAEPRSRGWSLALSLGELLWPPLGQDCSTGGQPWLCFTAPQPSRGQRTAWEGEQHCTASEHLQPCPVWMT